MEATMRQHHQTNLTRRALMLCAAVAVSVVFALLGVSVASAGSWIEVSCENPNQSAAPSEGWSSFSAGGGFGSNNSTNCAPGSPMWAMLSSAQAVSVGSQETLQYTPPSGSTLNGGSIDVSLYGDGYGNNASSTAVLYSPAFAYDSSDVFYQCAAGLTPCSPGSNDYAGVLPIPGGRGGNLFVSAGCGGNPGQTCNQGGSEGGWSLVRVHWANLLLTNTSTPTGSGFTGTILNPNTNGTADLNFTANDPNGPGVYLVTAQVDAKTVYSATPDTNGGKCASGGTSEGAPMFDYSQPCRISESITLPINTTTLSDGPHTLKVSVQDAAQNTSVVYDATITTHNATSGPLGANPGPGTNTQGQGVGAPNGGGASEQGQLRLGTRRSITRTYRRRALRINGRLLDPQGHPITAATLDVLEQDSGSSTVKLIGHAKTATNGTFTARVPGGPSRAIKIAYRAHAGDPGYAAGAEVKESVAAGVRLYVEPGHTTSTGTITLSGRVLGPVPAQGVIVELLVHYRGKWEPFRNPRTDSRGRFQVVYQFQGAIGRFPFRALAFGGQAGFPFNHGESRPVNVTAN
jgi:hypothetical protein